MKDFLLVRLIRYVGSKFDGYKTLIGGLGAFCIGLTYIIPVAFPTLSVEVGLPEGDLEKALASFTVAFTVWGIGGKLEKNKIALEAKPRTIVIKKKK